MNLNDDEFHFLVQQIYEAAGDPNLWNDFLLQLARSLRVDAASFVVHDFKNQHANLAVSVGIDPYWQQRYEQYYSKINEWTLRKPHLFRTGACLHGEDAISSRDLARTEYYADFLRPNHWLYSYGGVLSLNDSIASYISTLNTPISGPVSDPESEFLPTLMPHLQCSLRLHNRIAGLETRLNAASDALDRLPTGVITVDQDRYPLMINAAAERILSAKDGLSLVLKRIAAAKSEQDHAMATAIAAATSLESKHFSGSVLLISRPSGKRPLEVTVVPLPRTSSLKQGRRAAALFITDPEETPIADTAILQQVFGLTPSESRLAASLMSGSSINDYADEHKISLNTVRTHLKRIFSKTGTSRQSELIRLLLSSAAVLRRPDK